MFQTRRLRFRQFTPEDYPLLKPLLSDPAVMRHCSGPLTADGVQRWLAVAIAAYRQYGCEYWAAHSQETGAFIGALGILYQAIDGEPMPSLAYIIAPEYWGQGFAAEGAAGCLGYAARCLGLERVVATVEPDNRPSVRVLEKIGMRFERDISYAGNPACLYSYPKALPAPAAAGKADRAGICYNGSSEVKRPYDETAVRNAKPRARESGAGRPRYRYCRRLDDRKFSR